VIIALSKEMGEEVCEREIYIFTCYRYALEKRREDFIRFFLFLVRSKGKIQLRLISPLFGGG
jgi:hypothetical protein